MAKLIEFNTERLFLRQWKVSDRIPFAELNGDPKVMEFYPALLDHTASDSMANHFQSLITERGWGFWAVELQETGHFIGFVGLHIPVPEMPFSPCVEIGWRLAYKYWGKGLATEAAKGALQIGFGSLGLPEMVSFTSVWNIRSRAIMEKLHMKEEVHTFEHPAIPMGSRLRRHCLYRLRHEEWVAHTV